MNNNDEELFAYRVRQVLNEGADVLAPRVLARLQSARRKALDVSTQSVAVSRLSLGMAGVANWGEEAAAWVRLVIMALALSVGATGTYYWHQFKEAAENEELDSALLADELPPDAYMDTGFRIWLERTLDSSQE